MTKFVIGDTAHRAHAGQERVWVVCPECFGEGRLRVILGDNSEVSIACVCCERGYEGSPGRIQSYSFVASIESVLITGMESELRDGVLRTRYKFSGCNIADETDLFLTSSCAKARARQLVVEYEMAEAIRLKQKEKQTRTWASNVSYWRGEIRRAKETIQRAEARLSMAPKVRLRSASPDSVEESLGKRSA